MSPMPASDTDGATALRLLCVSHYFESHRGGIEMVAGQLARSLGDEGFEVTWAACDDSPPPSDISALALPAYNFIERKSGLPFPILSFRSFMRLIQKIAKSDAVIVHDGMYPISMAAVVASRLRRRPVILVQHIGTVPSKSKFLSIMFGIADRFFTRPMLRLATKVVFISETTARHFATENFRQLPSLVFNGVDTTIFRPSVSSDERKLERAELCWVECKPVILFVGRFLEKKGMLRLREMATQRPDIHFAFAGWGPCDPHSWRLENVSVHRGLSGRDLAPLYRTADMFVLPSHSEGFPLVVQESLSAGLPTICCDDGAKADPAAAAFVVGISNAGDEKVIVSRYLEAIDKLLSKPEDPALREQRSAFARDRYSWTATARKYVELLQPAAPIRNAPSAGTVTP
jgi:glycosyltransferase involved in cell wall biosynthesis